MSASDRFGDYGITGCILVDGQDIDSLLMSCRVLGKGIETAFLKAVMGLFRKDGYNEFTASFIPTAKNVQVSDFYDRCGFAATDVDESGVKAYRIGLKDADLGTEECYQISIVD